MAGASQKGCRRTMDNEETEQNKYMCMRVYVRSVTETWMECRKGKQRNYERLPMAIELSS